MKYLCDLHFEPNQEEFTIDPVFSKCEVCGERATHAVPGAARVFADELIEVAECDRDAVLAPVSVTAVSNSSCLIPGDGEVR